MDFLKIRNYAYENSTFYVLLKAWNLRLFTIE